MWLPTLMYQRPHLDYVVGADRLIYCVVPLIYAFQPHCCLAGLGSCRGHLTGIAVIMEAL